MAEAALCPRVSWAKLLLPALESPDGRIGGSFENRARFLLETVAAVREVWRERLPLTIRLGVIDYVEGEQPMEESIELIRRMKAAGMDLVDVSMGFETPDVSRVPWGEHGFLVPIAGRIRREVGIPAATSWNISDAKKSDRYVRDEQVDLILLGRCVLENPHWSYRAAQILGAEKPQNVLPEQYASWLKRQAKPSEADRGVQTREISHESLSSL